MSTVFTTMQLGNASNRLSSVVRAVGLSVGLMLLGASSAHAEGIESCGMHHVMDSDSLEFTRQQIEADCSNADSAIEMAACEEAYGDWQADLLQEWDSFDYCMSHAVADCSFACPVITDCDGVTQNDPVCVRTCFDAAGVWGW